VPDYRFRFELRGVGPISAANLEMAMMKAHTNGEPAPRIGMYGKVTGVRDGRPVGVQAIDLLQTRLSTEEAARALTRALASLGVHIPVPEPEVLS
jgi:hypothetical protein